METIAVNPVGRVKSSFKRVRPKRKKWSEVISRIVIKPEFLECLDDLEKYSHIVVLYWMHRAQRHETSCLRGAFATRLPFRPNPIGLTIAELLKIDGNVLTVKGLDAFDGSPIMDIKPYTGHPRDLVLEFRSPSKSTISVGFLFGKFYDILI